MAIARGVLELLAVSGRGEPDRASELAFRASLGRGGDRVVQRQNAQGLIATQDSRASASRDLRVRSPSVEGPVSHTASFNLGCVAVPI